MCHPSVRQSGDGGTQHLMETLSGSPEVNMRKISVRLTEQHYEILEALVVAGEYASTSEAIRDAIRRLIAEKADVLERAQMRNTFR